MSYTQKNTLKLLIWYGEGGGRRVQDGEHMYICGRSGWGTHVHLWQKPYNMVKLKNKIKKYIYKATDIFTLNNLKIT